MGMNVRFPLRLGAFKLVSSHPRTWHLRCDHENEQTFFCIHYLHLILSFILYIHTSDHGLLGL